MAKKKSDSIRIPFDKEEEGSGGRRRYPEGDYLFKIVGLKTGTSEDKGTPFVQANLEFEEGKFQGREMDERMYLTPKSLWRVRQFLEAIGLNPPKKAVAVPKKKVVGKLIAATLEDDEYENKIRSRVSEWLDEETYRGNDVDDEDEDEEDEDTEEEEDEDEEDEDEELEDLDLEDEL